MAINAKFGGKDFEIVPAGNHVARVYSIIHVGTIPGEYMGEPKETDTVRIGFELPNERKVFKEGEADRPFVISQEFTNSMNEKARLRALVEGILGITLDTEEAEYFDVLKLMGEPCMVNIVHKKSAKGTNYAKIQSAAPIPKGVTAPVATNEPFMLDFNDNWSEEKYGKLPQFLKGKIASSKEYRNMKGIAMPSADAVMDESNPF